MKGKLNIKTIIIIILFIILVFMSIAAIYLYTNNDNESHNNSSNENNSTEEITETVETKFKNAYYNNFLITYIIEGDIKTGEGTLKIEGSDDEYLAVDDFLLKDIHSLEDINNLIEDNLTEIATSRTIKVLESSYSNKYAVKNNTLYVKKNDNPCFKTEENIDMSKAEFVDEDGKQFLVYNRVPVSFIIEDDGKAKSSSLLYTCIKNFVTIKTGKNDVFEPTEDDLFKPSDFEFDEEEIAEE